MWIPCNCDRISEYSICTERSVLNRRGPPRANRSRQTSPGYPSWIWHCIPTWRIYLLGGIFLLKANAVYVISVHSPFQNCQFIQVLQTRLMVCATSSPKPRLLGIQDTKLYSKPFRYGLGFICCWWNTYQSKHLMLNRGFIDTFKIITFIVEVLGDSRA